MIIISLFVAPVTYTDNVCPSLARAGAKKGNFTLVFLALVYCHISMLNLLLLISCHIESISSIPPDMSDIHFLKSDVRL